MVPPVVPSAYLRLGRCISDPACRWLDIPIYYLRSCTTGGCQAAFVAVAVIAGTLLSWLIGGL